MNTTITDYQRKLILHATGAEPETPNSRNWFAADPNSGEGTEWERLVGLGYANIVVEPRYGYSNYRIYRVTKSGRKAAR